MNKSARFCLLYNSRNMLKLNDSILYIKMGTFLTFILSKHDIRDIYVMTFCNLSIVVVAGLYHVWKYRNI